VTANAQADVRGAEARRRAILAELSAGQEVAVPQMAQRLGVSEMTIRRDLNRLHGDGGVQRTHGGAVMSRAGIVEFAFVERGRANAAAKRAIAAEVAKLIEPGMSVCLDTGTTALEVAKAIAGVERLRVLTSSLPIASALYARDNIELILLGGLARRGSPDLSGWLTEKNLKEFQPDVAVLGADAVGPRGAFTTDPAVARVSAAMTSCARLRVLAVDSSKFSRTALVRYAQWSNIDRLVTDDAVIAADRRWLKKAVAHVTFVRTRRR
jgi:DeoR/GlpR family transcriptional regulator of sugar metabolism